MTVESFGERLKAAREAKKLSIKDVNKETKINPLYIEALEEEKFDAFPGEAYLLGFLRSYSEYLKLDADAIIEAYKGYKKGESDTPLDELIKPLNQSFSTAIADFFSKYKTFVAIVLVVAALCGVFFGVKNAPKIFGSSVDVSDGTTIEKMKDKFKTNNLGVDIDNIKTMQLHNDEGFILVYTNEAVQFLVDKKEVVFLLKEIKQNAVTVQIIPGQTTEEIAMNQTVTPNIPDSPREVKMTLKGLTAQRAKIQVALGERFTEDVEPDTQNQETVGDTTTVEVMNAKNLKIVLQTSFTEKSFLEIYLDGAQRYRGFVDAGHTERWEANEFIQIKAGNAGGLKAVINGREYNFGKSGQVVNKTITWRKDTVNPNRYHIMVKDQ